MATTMPKPIVVYDECAHIIVGHATWLIPINHPSPRVKNGDTCRTSEVLEIAADGTTFFTKNTEYRKL